VSEAQPTPRAAASATTSTRPVDTGADSAPDDGSGYGSSPDTVRHRFDPGRTTYTVTKGDVTLMARFSTMRAPSGTPVDLVLEATSGAPSCCSLGVWYGDGAGKHQDGPFQPPQCPNVTGTSSRLDAAHTWNKAQRWVLLIQASRTGCDNKDTVYLAMQVTIEITPGTSTSNGPFQPWVHVNESAAPVEGDRSYMSYYGEARDDDGWISRLELDYGDGSPPVSFPGDENDCRQGRGGQPLESRAFLPHDPPHTHRYEAADTCTVTLRAWSEGCNGREVQTGVATYTYTVP
jgi:hypothetical protein